jgi:hypothetical protein
MIILKIELVLNNMKIKYLGCLKDIVKEINSIHFFINARAKATYFTRKSKLNFEDLVYFIINMGKKNLDLEIANYLENVKVVNMDYTKQAFSKARQKILPSAFKKLNNNIIKNVYTDDEYKTYKGYRLLAIDSSTSELPNNEELRKEYGYCTAKKIDIAMGRISGLYDVENEIIIDAVIDRYDCNEQILATNHINSLINHGLRKDLILFDRGYPSSNLITLLAKNKIDYLMRVQKNFIRKLVETRQNDEIVKLKLKGQELQIRVVKVILESGAEEILITSILDSSMTSEELKDLYFKRWKFETKYNELKNRLEIECYSGETKVAIEQDFYITIFLSNMASLAREYALR